MQSIYRADFFDNENFDKIKKSVLEKVNDQKGLRYGKDCTRDYKIVFFSDEIHDMLLDRAKQETSDNSLEIIYNQIVRYSIKDGIPPELKKHKDKAVGEWVMDIVLDGTVDWPLIIENESFSNVPNSVIFIRGEEEEHWRPEFPSKDENDYILLLFVHLADKDSRHAKVSRELRSLGDAAVTSFLNSAEPAWGTSYEG